MPLKLNGSTSGYVIVDAPAVAGTNTLTLPAVTDTITTNTATQTLTNKTLSSPTFTGTSSSDISTSGTVVMGSPFTMRNKIINGAMQVSQRGTSITIGSDRTYTADRWYCSRGGTVVYSYRTSGSFNPPVGYRAYAEYVNNSAGNPFMVAGQTIETLNCWDLAGQTVTVTFRARANANTAASKTLAVTVLYNTVADTGGGFVISTQNASLNFGTAAIDWLTYSYQFAIPSNALTVSVEFAQNSLAVGDGFHLTGVQLERGTAATPFEYRNFGQELTMCQRYYETTYDYGVAPGSSTGGGVQLAYYSANTPMRYGTTYMVPKRATPTVTLYDWAGNSGKISYYNGSWQNNLTPGLVSGTTTFLTIHNYPASGNEYSAQWSLSAEI